MSLNTAEVAKKLCQFLAFVYSKDSGEILACCRKALACAGNLVYINQQYTFGNITSKEHKDYSPDAERTLYDIYRGENEKAAFEQAVKVFGKHYDMIAYLFFVKDSSRFLPDVDVGLINAHSFLWIINYNGG